jgi:hypothetical protein
MAKKTKRAKRTKRTRRKRTTKKTGVDFVDVIMNQGVKAARDMYKKQAAEADKAISALQTQIDKIRKQRDELRADAQKALKNISAELGGTSSGRGPGRKKAARKTAKKTTGRRGGKRRRMTAKQMDKAASAIKSSVTKSGKKIGEIANDLKQKGIRLTQPQLANLMRKLQGEGAIKKEGEKRNTVYKKA